MEKEKRKNENPRPNIFLMLVRAVWAMTKGMGKGIGWLMSHTATGSWFLMKQFGWLTLWLLKQPYRLLRYIISGRIPEFENARQEEIFWRIKRQYRRKRLFLLNALAYTSSILIAILNIGYTYFEYQKYPDSWYQYQFYNALSTAAVFMGIWTFVLIFHFVFNKMGDSEDKALGDALENEYARSDAREFVYEDPSSRLAETRYDESDYYKEDKPKRNGAKL